MEKEQALQHRSKADQSGTVPLMEVEWLLDLMECLSNWVCAETPNGQYSKTHTK
jgi:hypothetical protein